MSEHEKLSERLHVMVSPSMKAALDALVELGRKTNQALSMGDVVREAVRQYLRKAKGKTP